MKLSKIIELSIPFLWDGVEEYQQDHKEAWVCCTFDRAYEADLISYKDIAKASNYITSLITPYAFVTDWLEARIGENPRYAYGTPAVQEYRLRWMHHMIKTLKAQGR
jgi:hypothetical protein